jgi:hypothetical protein
MSRRGCFQIEFFQSQMPFGTVTSRETGTDSKLRIRSDSAETTGGTAGLAAVPKESFDCSGDLGVGFFLASMRQGLSLAEPEGFASSAIEMAVRVP